MIADLSTQVVDQDRWHRLFKFAPLVIILLYMRTRPERPVTQVEISEEFSIDRKTAAASLRQLSNLGMVAHMDHNNGYMLADGGQQMLLDFDAGWGKNGHLPLKESLKDLKDLKIKIKKERRKGMGIFWTSPEGLTTEKILSETGRLFGFETIAHGIADRAPEMAMSLIAHAYDQKDRLATPQIFVYRRLQRNVAADKKYLAEPLKFLPNDFLHALGLAELEAPVAEIEIVDAVVESANEDDQQAAPSEAVQVWGAVTEQLLHETLTPQLRKAVEQETRPRSLTGGVLLIDCVTAYARDLLESRLTSSINRLLIGICQSGMQVEFVSTETGALR